MNDSTAWRFSVHTNGTYMNAPVQVIQRGRMYQLPSDWTSDSWRNYWDCDQMVAVYLDPRNYNNPTTGEDTERTAHAIKMCYSYDQDVDDMLTRLARRLTGNWNSRFISVSLDRGTTLYALTWDGSDPEHNAAWRDEIEAVYHGDIWRIEVEEYSTFTERWHPADEICEEYYGEDSAERGFHTEFPLAEFPAELLLTEAGA